MAAWLLPFVVQFVFAVRTDDVFLETAGESGVPILVPRGGSESEPMMMSKSASSPAAPIFMSKDQKWLLMMQEGASELEHAVIKSDIPRLGFYNAHTGVWEYIGSKQLLERDIKHNHLEGKVRYAVVDSLTGLVPETLDMSTARSTFSGLWGLDKIGAKEYPSKGEGIHVFVFDTGIHGKHPGFAGKMIQKEFDMKLGEGGPTGACADLAEDDCSRDMHGHGTHVAGTIAAEGVGVAPGATLHAMKVLDDQGVGKLSWLVRGFNHMMDSSRVHRQAFGSETLIASVGVQSRAVSRLMNDVLHKVNAAGIVVVVAAGNAAQDACITTPANAQASFTVAAMDKTNNAAPFSDRGQCVDIFAPGVSVESLHLGVGERQLRRRSSGNTMAAAHVAGAMALLLAEKTDLKPQRLKQLVLERSLKNRIHGNLQYSPNKALYVRTDEPDACAETPEYHDVRGHTCASWSWHFFSLVNCEKGGLWASYTEADLQDVRSNCPVACGLC